MKGLMGANVRAHWSRYIATSLAIMLATAFIMTCFGISGGVVTMVGHLFAANTQGADAVVTQDFKVLTYSANTSKESSDKDSSSKDSSSKDSSSEASHADSKSSDSKPSDEKASDNKASDSEESPDEFDNQGKSDKVAKALRDSGKFRVVFQGEFYVASLENREGKLRTALVTMPPKPIESVPLKSGHYPTGTRQIAISTDQAKSLKVTVGDEIDLSYTHLEKADPQQLAALQAETKAQGGDQNKVPTELPKDTTVKVKVVGLLDQPVSLGASNSYASEDLLKDNISKQPIQFMLLVGKEGETPETVAKNANQVIESAGMQESFKAETQSKFVRDKTQEFTNSGGILLAIMMIFPGIAALTAIIVISVTFQVLLAQRRRELALLRAVGATKAQVRSLVIREALLVGSIASILGILVGSALSMAVNVYYRLVVNIPEAISALGIWQPAVVFAVGLIMTIFAALGPARRVAKVSPMVALHPEDAAVTVRRRAWVRLAFGLLFFLAGAAAVFYGFSVQIGSEIGPGDNNKMMMRFASMFLGSLLGFVGILLLSTLVMPHVTAFLGRVVGRGSVVTQIAAENTRRNPARTGATSTALILGITLVVTMMVGAQSMSATMNQELDKARPFDLTIMSNTARSTDDIKKVSHLDSVTEATALPGIVTKLNNPTKKTDDLQFVYELGDLSKVSRQKVAPLKDDEIYVNGYLWGEGQKKITVTVGDTTLTLTPKQSRIPGYTVNASVFKKLKEASEKAGTLKATSPQASNKNPADNKPNSDSLGSLQVSLKNHEGELVDNALIMARMKDSSSVTNVNKVMGNLQKDFPHDHIGGGAPERFTFSTVINMMLYSIVAMLAVSILVALVGVSNTLALSVVERRRENALLRAVGMTRSAMKSMLTIEAALIGFASIAVGVGLGILFGAIGLHSLPFPTTGKDALAIVISVPWLEVLGSGAIALLVAVLASWWPGRSAAKAAPVEALAGAE